MPGGAASAGLPLALVGLDAPREVPSPPADLCTALFGDPGDAVPVAFFTDHYCPNCRAMAEALDAADRIAVTRHELPILGEGSVIAARAALAADLQDGREAFHARMRRAVFAPTAAYVAQVAEGLGLDAERLMVDMQGPEVAAALRRDTDLAAALGFGVVPVTVVGRTVVVGDVGARMLGRLIAAERREGWPCPGGLLAPSPAMYTPASATPGDQP